jgi:hypothetical protein
MPNFFVGAKDKMEMQKVPQAGSKFKGCGFGLAENKLCKTSCF